MSDTSWIKPGMYITVTRGKIYPNGGNGGRPDGSYTGSVLLVHARDGNLLALQELVSHYGTRYDENARMLSLDLTEWQFRELSPAYVEAMTGKVSPPGYWEAEAREFKAQAEAMERDRDRWKAKADQDWTILGDVRAECDRWKARTADSDELACNINKANARLEARINKAKAAIDGWCKTGPFLGGACCVPGSAGMMRVKSILDGKEEQ